MSNQTIELFESDEIDEYIKYNREYRFTIQNIRKYMYVMCDKNQSVGNYCINFSGLKNSPNPITDGYAGG